MLQRSNEIDSAGFPSAAGPPARQFRKLLIALLDVCFEHGIQAGGLLQPCQSPGATLMTPLSIITAPFGSTMTVCPVASKVISQPLKQISTLALKSVDEVHIEGVDEVGIVIADEVTPEISGLLVDLGAPGIDQRVGRAD